MRRVIVLGSTGSIGVQALEVIAANPDRFELVGLPRGATARTRRAGGRDGRDPYGARRRRGRALVRETPADVVLNGITGSVGLAPTLAALESGATLALANKECLIVGGELVTRAAQPGQLVPVDSEHSAIAQALRAGEHREVRRLVLTASGGPFRGRDRESLAGVTPAEALAHPTWDMGPVVTTNSATLVNKGLEVIEAHLLFDVPFDRIDVGAPAVDRALHGRVRRRLDDRPGLPARHAAADLARPRLAEPGRGCRGPAGLDDRAAWDFEPLDGRRSRRSRSRSVSARRRHLSRVFNAANEQAVEAFHAGGSVPRHPGDHRAGRRRHGAARRRRVDARRPARRRGLGALRRRRLLTR